ncbi:MAG: Acyl-CoA:1-acyl-sn-glycerol-3-phosphate acyltransferase [uncultured Sphingomonas sp.]|uniref:Acyl-CoA:1-acyl-sn-glycerol-3-phosphate acyltransferase n=1 Tax=uncultured Sphingomonas sp. TaxID=158754 RepID=A0A6J4TNT2_9SPHN|nr:lysophospholipid acyltransferase family protein [uncultured Sphingomonas sp.]CAA9527085.1 MAG: Acyl-CoA:1-acyl-sn-glycerol-3-phosphate acyltransferase [uncultured Sphingomonas sp.]
MTGTVRRVRPSLPLAALRILALGGWLAVAAPLHLLARGRGQSDWPRRFLAGVARIAGARVRTAGEPIAGPTLIIANHTSWLDIPVLAGATGCAFVSKDELQGQRLMHWLCKQNGTVFVDRSDKRGIADQTGQMLRALHRRQPLALFPEGTVSDGTRLLPFRPALLSAFAPAPAGVFIRPVAIDYGGAAPEFGWPQGETGKRNFLRMIGRRGTVAVTLHLLPPVDGLDRKQLARAAHDAIAAALLPSGIAPAAV